MRHMRQDVSTMQYNALAKLGEIGTIRIPDWHEVRRNSGNWKKRQLENIDLSKVSGRLQYHRIQNGVSCSELDKHLGFTKGSYRRSFESPAHEPSDVAKVKQICEYLHVSKEEVFDDYLRFLESDFSTALLSARKRLGYTQKEMAGKIGVNRSVYQDWEKGRKAPTRRSWGRMEGGLAGILEK